MKKLFAILIAALAMVSCEEAQNNTAAPTVDLIAMEATESSIRFIMNTTNAEESAYMILEENTTTADYILNNGIKSESGIITISDLDSDTEYIIVAAARNGNTKVMAKPLVMTTQAGSGNNNNGDNGNNGNNGDLPDIEGVENIVITKTKDGRWYEPYNYYVTFVRDNGDRIILDFYTLDETMSQYFPYGQYTFATNYAPYTIHPETSGYVPAGKSADGEGYNFTDGYVSVDVVNGYYAIYMMLTYEEDGVSKSIQGYYNGILSGASVPEGDDNGSEELIEVLEVGTSSFSFRINAEADQYWRCSVVDKRT